METVKSLHLQLGRERVQCTAQVIGQTSKFLQSLLKMHCPLPREKKTWQHSAVYTMFNGFDWIQNSWETSRAFSLRVRYSQNRFQPVISKYKFNARRKVLRECGKGYSYKFIQPVFAFSLQSKPLTFSNSDSSLGTLEQRNVGSTEELCNRRVHDLGAVTVVFHACIAYRYIIKLYQHLICSSN